MESSSNFLSNFVNFGCWVMELNVALYLPERINVSDLNKNTSLKDRTHNHRVYSNTAQRPPWQRLKIFTYNTIKCCANASFIFENRLILSVLLGIITEFVSVILVKFRWNSLDFSLVLLSSGFTYEIFTLYRKPRSYFDGKI